MSLGSLLALSEPTLSPGEEATVCVAVATLWVGPDRVRPVDSPALSHPAKPRMWVNEMTPADRDDLRGRVLTQLLLGERVRILELRGDWAHVIALGQPTSLDPRGYPGWLPSYQLATVDSMFAAGIRVATGRRRGRRGAAEDEEIELAPDRSGMVHLVDATATTLRDEPDGALVMPGVTFGTRLVASGRSHDGWLPVAVPGRFEPAWAVEDDVTPEPAAPPVDPQEIVAMADRLRDVPYIWGGASAYGVDCSGLVHLTWRRFGVTVPRDAADQAASTAPVPLGSERPGDLYFFATGGKVDHVGFVAQTPDGDQRWVLHASQPHGRVVLEEVAGERAATLVAAHRVVVN
ncbi:C40 family peptidase [Luedemannella helvata]|uniref:NlpC/P60 family protein n=1 Tax=Luedemannella helvata TaxID=349315 RepID=A0ABN2KU29_9ACTN